MRVTFSAGETAAAFTVTATDDAVDEDDEHVALGFGTLPAGVTPGSPSGVTVTLADDDARAGDGVGDGAGDRRGRQRVVHGGADLAADRGRDRDGGAVVRHRGVAGPDHAHLHRRQLADGTDGHGHRGGRRRRGGARRGDHPAHRRRRRRRLRRRRRRRRGGADRRDRHPGARPGGGRARRRGRRQPDLHHPHERGQQRHGDGGVVDRRRHGAGRQGLHGAGRQRDVPARRDAAPHRQRADHRRSGRRAGRDLHGDAERPRARGAGCRRRDRHHRRRRQARREAVGSRAGVPRRRPRQLHDEADLAADRGR